jgi:putative FmdB family regulatory protein
MPLYDYVCTSCGHRLEVMHSVHGHGPSACPVCGSPMKKAYAPPAVHFKGSGWARKDRSSKPARASEKPAPSEGSSSANSSASKTTKDE